MRIAVTGANGFIGQALCPFLRQSFKADLVILTRNSSITSDNQLSFSATDEELIAGLGNIDCLIHLAARAHTQNATPSDFQRDNVELSERVARLCVEANVPRFIYLSSIKVNGESTDGRRPFSADETPKPEDMYGQSKLMSEDTLKKHLANTKTRLVIIRPPLVYGDNNKGNLRSLEKLINIRIPMPFGGLKNQRDLVSLENLCRLISITITHPRAADEIFLVSDGIARNTKEIVQLLAHRLGKQARFINVPNWIFSFLKKIKPSLIDRLTGNLQVDIEKTRSLLG
ncbi:MAG: NAD-dependent epimerase/dehydratase family protein, partial [Chitinophagaceae bacterium]